MIKTANRVKQENKTEGNNNKKGGPNTDSNRYFHRMKTKRARNKCTQMYCTKSLKYISRSIDRSPRHLGEGQKREM
ncbi:hypothetical protein I7I50_05543 [Histoplasma capsulatum G186AR]|uniref:Uncharacterized protein n=1 Tax=Ajellomyces capsulatus TaxID=5037 RepID=A0A8H7Z9X0_AJECA|nr:hypothetical protein I7I52_03803 [Histoplasma capsulatum]QSS76177.1 hypothetical protein I7I50_05543 [Histoplasma capsulatum G186AR]